MPSTQHTPEPAVFRSEKGAINGVASLDSNGLVPNSQLPGATQSAAGTMSAADKTKLDGIATGATANVVSDSLSDTSTTNALSAAKGKALNDSVTALNTQKMNGTVFEFSNLSVFSDSSHRRLILRGNYPNADYLQAVFFGDTKEIQIMKSVGGTETALATFVDANKVSSYTGSTYSLGAISANGYGKKDYTIAIPSGYKTTPICSINMVDGSMYTNGLTLIGNVSSGQTGNANVSVEYRTVGAITSGNDRFQFYVMIIPV